MKTKYSELNDIELTILFNYYKHKALKLPILHQYKRSIEEQPLYICTLVQLFNERVRPRELEEICMEIDYRGGLRALDIVNEEVSK